MNSLKFKEEVCAAYPSADCLFKCQYMESEKDEAHDEMIEIKGGEDVKRFTAL